MKYKTIFFIILISIVDCLLFIYSLVNSSFLMKALIIHIMLYLIIDYLDDKYLDEYEGVPKYLALFLPGLGNIIIAILYFSLYYFLRDSLILEDYERYINYQSFLDKKLRVDFVKEMKTLSFLDQMGFLDPENKKKLIIDSSLNEYANIAKLLQKGLSDEDNEVKHYSAVTLNMLENEYSFKINQLRESYNQSNNVSTLLKLSEAYRDYIESDLLTDDVLQVFNYEYIQVLNKILKVNNETFEMLVELIKAYIRSNQLELAENIISLLDQQYPGKFEVKLYKMNIAYKKKDYRRLKKLLDDLMNNNIEIPKDYENMLAFWTRKGDRK